MASDRHGDEPERIRIIRDDDEPAVERGRERPARSERSSRPAMSFPLSERQGPGSDDEWDDWDDDTAVSDTVAGETVDDDLELPHWSEPPTGQVPQVVVDEAGESTGEWAALGEQPRWRDQDYQYDDDGELSDIVDESVGVASESDVFFDDEDDFSDWDGSTADDDGPYVGDAGGTGQHGVGGVGGLVSGGDRDLGVAALVGVGLVVLGLVCFRIGALATVPLIAVVLGVAGFEYFTTTTQAGYDPALPLGIAGIAGFALGAYVDPVASYPVVAALATVLGLVWYFWVQPGEGAVMNLGVTLLGTFWIGGLGGFASLLLGFGARLGTEGNNGMGILITAVMVSVTHDVAAYFGGRALGSRALNAASPNKTIEGMLTGIVVGALVPLIIVLAAGMTPMREKPLATFVLCLACAAVAPLGDLAQSAVKRDLGVKDMGTLLPGHGGVLDRFDALLFVLPTAFMVARVFGISPVG